MDGVHRRRWRQAHINASGGINARASRAARAFAAALFLAGVVVKVAQLCSPGVELGPKLSLAFAGIGNAGMLRQIDVSTGVPATMTGGSAQGFDAVAPAGNRATVLPRKFFGPFAGESKESADGRKAHIAVVDVQVLKGFEGAFEDATLENCRASVQEESNVRFDFIKSNTDRGRYALVEIYRDAEGPAQHKQTEHYLKWRESVEDMMQRPRSASQWDIIFPNTLDGFEPVSLLLERDPPNYFNVSQVTIDVAYGQEKLFRRVTQDYAEKTSKESSCMRCDFLQSMDNPRRFMFIKVYRIGSRNAREVEGSSVDIKAAEKHFTETHYLKWREVTAGMLAKPKQERWYFNVFPSVPAGWYSDTQYNS